MRRQLVFGYGSLLAEEAGVECRLRNHELGWDVAMDNREIVPGYKVYVDPRTGLRPEIEVAFLSITPEPGESVDGLAFPVSDEKLAELDERERNYVRHDVTELVDADLGGRIWAYVGSAAGRLRLARGRRRGTAVVSRRYLEKVGVPTELPVRTLLRCDVST